jgi:hypothetical protein
VGEDVAANVAELADSRISLPTAKAKEAFPAFEDRSRLTIKEIAQLLKDRQFLE